MRLLGILLTLSIVLLERSTDAKVQPRSTTRHVYYVATTGSDANPGTEALPFRTLARGVRGLTPGDTLYIKSGTYEEALIHSIPPGTSWNSPVTVAAAPDQTVILKPNRGAEFVLRFQGPQQYIVIDGLILDGTNVTYDVVKITWRVSGDPATAAHHIRLQNSEVRNATLNTDSKKQGILVSGQGADWNEFVNLHVHHNGLSEYDHGLYIESSHNVVDNCLIHHNAGYGVHIFNEYPGGRANGNVISSNRIFANSRRGILLGSGDGNVARDNIVWDNRGGIRIAFFDPTNNQVHYNTVYGNTDYGILVENGTAAVVKNNIAYANGTTNLQDNAIGSIVANNLTDTDPKFVNAAAGDFRLQPGSRAIDMGARNRGVATNRQGTRQPRK